MQRKNLSTADHIAGKIFFPAMFFFAPETGRVISEGTHPMPRPAGHGLFRAR
jgi:hypothetical protein